jgi:two-component system response regulator DevR
MNLPDQRRIRLFIVDDHEVVRIGLRTLFGRAPRLEVVGEAGSVQTAVAETQRLAPDVVLMDIRLPDGSGFDACRLIQKLHLDTRVLVLTSFADDEVVFDAIAAGADGYLLKEIDGDGLIRAVESVAAGQSILDPSVTRRVLARIKSGADEAGKDEADLISAQERRVLALVAQGKTNKEIAADLGLSDKTVKNYLSNVLDKLKLSRRAQAAAFYVQHLAA